MLNRKNDIRPFEDVTSLEFLLDKNDCALFAVGTHNKKRPLNLVMVRACTTSVRMVWLRVWCAYTNGAEHSGTLSYPRHDDT